MEIDLFIQFVNHVLPIILTVLLFFMAVAMHVGGPKCQYIARVANANTDKGREDLAKYLARQAGGRKIDNDNSWRAYMPAARDLHRKHLNKRRESVA